MTLATWLWPSPGPAWARLLQPPIWWPRGDLPLWQLDVSTKVVRALVIPLVPLMTFSSNLPTYRQTQARPSKFLPRPKLAPGQELPAGPLTPRVAWGWRVRRLSVAPSETPFRTCDSDLRTPKHKARALTPAN